MIRENPQRFSCNSVASNGHRLFSVVLGVCIFVVPRAVPGSISPRKDIFQPCDLRVRHLLALAGWTENALQLAFYLRLVLTVYKNVWLDPPSTRNCQKVFEVAVADDTCRYLGPVVAP